MSVQFNAVTLDHPAMFDEIGRLSPRSPFNTRAYAEASSVLGLQPYCLYATEGATITGGCVALLMTGSWRRRLEFPSLPCLTHAAAFWDFVQQFCRDHNVIELQINSFASEEVSLPPFEHQLTCRDRCEYIVDLEGDLDAKLGTNHRRNIKKARKSDLKIARTRTTDASKQHLSLMHKSANRRTARGEQVDVPDDAKLHAALLGASSGELFQARKDDEILSSILIVGGVEAAYYHSAGTSPAGMKTGASQFLISEVCRALQRDGLHQLNLGGADTDGLRTFKLGFGAVERPLQAASYSMVSPLARKAQRLTYLARRVPAKLFEILRR